MIASSNILRAHPPLSPFVERTLVNGLTYGCGPAGYDVRIAETVELNPGDFILASTVEEFDMPLDMLGIVHDKSTWARMGLALQNTVIECGWRGFLTLELSNHSRNNVIQIKSGAPIAQVVFHLIGDPDERGYSGKYQDQKRGPQAAIFEDGAGR